MSPDTADKRTSLLVWGALAIVYVVWGSTYLGIMITIETIPPLASGAMRFAVAAVVLAAAVLLFGGREAFRMTWKEFCGAAVVGLLLLTAGNGMVALAEQHISSGLAALLVASVPLWLVIFRIVMRDRPRVLTLTGVLVGFGGVAALSLTGGSGAGTTTGIVIILLASLSWSIGSFLSSRIPMPANPFAASAVEMVVGAAGLAVTATVMGERLDLAAVSGRSWAALAYLILVGSLVGFTSYVWLLGNAPISLVSTYAYVNPVVAVVLGALILSEPVTGSMVTAGLVIVVGVALVVSTERRRQAAPADGEPVAVEATSRV
ncbi:drug/metabolite exporter YedA [Planobispora rosea]|uniref:Drug/metabolite exporter YedA n=1 Tax=Planobispora rosea TaxID=35762 RepID=A0A8J3S7V0_PLARO|nr:EamA family transporter [Planobispora rosea]GGS61836.1 drug/metabolite exporter YedA [Planobispora rosea]GIH86574.1 drug/metabolite exporter YedA [Planobispora rosea]